MVGQLVYLVGPSGSGKDSILRQLAQDLPDSCVIMRRVITRPASETEDAESLTAEEFALAEAKGDFALCWQANHLQYGIRTGLDEQLAQGKTVLVNGSRAHWPQVVEQYPQAILAMVHVDESLLKERLVLRGRESMQEIQARLMRNAALEQALKYRSELENGSLWWLNNTGALHIAVAELRQYLTQLTL